MLRVASAPSRLTTVSISGPRSPFSSGPWQTWQFCSYTARPISSVVGKPALSGPAAGLCGRARNQSACIRSGGFSGRHELDDRRHIFRENVNRAVRRIRARAEEQCAAVHAGKVNGIYSDRRRCIETGSRFRQTVCPPGLFVRLHEPVVHVLHGHPLAAKRGHDGRKRLRLRGHFTRYVALRNGTLLDRP